VEGERLCYRGKVRFFLTAIVLAILAVSSIAQAHTGRAQPARRTVEKLESGIAFWDEAAMVGLPGVIGASDAGRRWRVRVRQLSCQPSKDDVSCSYETRPCLDALTDAARQTWCTRERRFIRGAGVVMADGWIVAAVR
jgi:hypothetical protein